MMKDNKLKEEFEKLIYKIKLTDKEYSKIYKAVIKKGNSIENALTLLNFITVFFKAFSIFFVSTPKLDIKTKKEVHHD